MLGARDIVQEALVSAAIAESSGSRTGAATLLGVPGTRVADYLRRYPWLAKRWPGKRGRPPLATVKAYVSAQQGEPAPTAGAPSSPAPAAAKAGVSGASRPGDLHTD